MPRREITLLGLLLIAGWIVWLRAPALVTPVWSVDEGITAAIADEINAGGLPFRDATDLRPPLTYYLYAAVFAVAGSNNMAAIHLAHTGLVLAIAGLVFLLGRRTGGPAAGWWALWIYAGVACAVLPPLDNFALHTEWPLALGCALGALLGLAGLERGRNSWLAAAGLCYGCAALSKQPALLDLGAPLAVLVLLICRRPAAAGRPGRQLLALLGGAALPLVVAAAYFAAHGALADLVFYTWTYNTRYYVPEMPLAARWSSIRVPLALLQSYPPALPACLLVSLVLAGRALFRPEARPDEAATARLALPPAWFLCSLAATTLSGRGFEHYSVQLLAPASLLAGQVLGKLTDWTRAQSGWLRRLPVGGLLAGLALWQAGHAWNYRRSVRPHVDPGVPVARFVQSITSRADRVFVWGFYTDINTLADRLPGTRFVHSAFLTGVIPWTNLGRDTGYAIVPGSMAALLADLERNRPRVIVDASQNPARRFLDYPPGKFPEFRDYLDRHYGEIEPGRFSEEGFRLFLRWHEAAPVPPGPPAGSPAPACTIEQVDPDFSGIATYLVHGGDPRGQLRRLGWIDPAASRRYAEFTPAAGGSMVFRMPDDPGPAAPRAFAETTDGRQTVTPGAGRIPRLAPGQIPARLALTAPAGSFPAEEVLSVHLPQPVDFDGGEAVLCHAPTAVRFPLPPGGGVLHLGYGLAAGAYATPDHGTDGVEFIVQLQPARGEAVVLHRRWLRPAETVADRGLQEVTLPLPRHQAGDRLILLTRPGPAYASAYDWSYWVPPVLSGEGG